VCIYKNLAIQGGFLMNNFNAMRRDILRTGGIGMAAAAIPAVSFAASAEDGKSAVHPVTHLFDVRTYGATGDGKTLDTKAINNAIEAAAGDGGGVVLFPAGSYLCFSIRLKSQVHLHLEQGSAIVAADSPREGDQTGYNGGVYDAAEPNTAWDAYQDYGHNHWHNSLLWGEDIHSLSITGPGLIWGKGLSFGAERAARGSYPTYKAEQPGVGNKAIALKNCHNVLLRDFSVLKGGHFALLLTGVDNLTIDNLKGTSAQVLDFAVTTRLPMISRF
jgi:polygalacturonase